MRMLVGAVAATLSLACTVADAEEVGDARQGLAYAKTACAECHAVEAGRKLSPDLNAPSFEAVANTAGITARAIVVWLQSSHPTMPNLMINPDDRDNLVAYIMSLSARPQ